MTDRFHKCADFVLTRETEYGRGGVVKVERDPNDPGGTTKYGIDQRSHPDVDIAGLTRDEAKEIYYKVEWSRCRCDELPQPWDMAVFDSAVNPGMGWTIPALQGIAGTKVDGFIGPKTIAAVQKIAASGTKLEAFLRARQLYYQARPNTLKGKPFRTRFLKGWLARVDELRTEVMT